MKMQKKWEGLDKDKTNWKENGLNDLKYKLISKTDNEQLVTVVVDVLLNKDKDTNKEASIDYVIDYTKK